MYNKNLMIDNPSVAYKMRQLPCVKGAVWDYFFVVVYLALDHGE